MMSFCSSNNMWGEKSLTILILLLHKNMFSGIQGKQFLSDVARKTFKDFFSCFNCNLGLIIPVIHHLFFFF